VLFDQSDYDLRCEWGLQGLAALAPSCDALVIVDVLSFSTTVDIVVANGASVLPWRWGDDSAVRFAAGRPGHVAATHRSISGYSLSPASVRTIPRGETLVLPSPNGATLCVAATHGAIFTACLRNAPAVTEYLRRFAKKIAVIAAGEQWDDGALRPCLEDWIGAGAVLSVLPGTPSPEAELAIAGFQHVRSDLPRMLSCCGSGKELIGRGFACDVTLPLSTVQVPPSHGSWMADSSTLRSELHCGRWIVIPSTVSSTWPARGVSENESFRFNR